MNKFKCPHCGDTQFTLHLAYVSDDKGNEVLGQPVISCEEGCTVIPYLGEQANRETITHLEARLGEVPRSSP